MGEPNHRRADWRFLLPEGPRVHTLIVEPSGSNDRAWRWLVEDGWTERVTVTDGRTPHKAVDGPAPDVILVRSGSDYALAADRAAPTASIVIELPRSGRELLWPTTDRLVAAGFEDVRRYLASPNLENPKRLTPLAGGGLRWLLGPPPLTARGRIGRAVATAIRSVAIGAAEVALSTRLVAVAGQTLVVGHRSGSGDRGGGSSGGGSSGGGDRGGGSSGGGDRGGGSSSGGSRGGGGDAVDWPGGHGGDAVLMTSGHDEGSRVILLPLDGGRSEPEQVLKIAPRPRFNHNVEMELEVLRSRLTKGGDPAKLLPRSLGSFTVGGELRGSRESYAGRWTASDLGYRQPGTRDRVLATVLGAATGLATTTATGEIAWSDSLFDQLIGRLHDRHAAMVGRTDERDELIELLADRSKQLVGRPLPMIRRHYDLGPWNVVFGSDGRPTVIDWELAPPRRIDIEGPAGADHLYFAKYWLHICLGTESVADELRAFEFLGEPPADDQRHHISAALAAEFDKLGLDHGFVPILAAHIWLEKALYTMARHGSDPGAAGPYLDALAHHRHRLLDHWRLGRSR